MFRKNIFCVILFAVLCSNALADRIISGTYYGDLYLTADANLTEGPVTLAGMGQILDCQGHRLTASRNVTHTAIHLEAKGITVRNCVITNRFMRGITAGSLAIEFDIRENTISARSSGVSVHYNDSSRRPGNIRKNKFINNFYGVDVYLSKNMRITENDFTHSSGLTGNAILALESENVLARLNKMSSTSSNGGGAAISFSDGRNNVARQNTISGARRAFGVEVYSEVDSDVLDNTITGIGYVGIFLVNSVGSVVRNNVASNNGGRVPVAGQTIDCGGILLQNSHESDILENVVRNNIAPGDRNCVGITLFFSDDNRLFDNVSAGNEYGAYLWDSDDNLYDGNTISGNSVRNIFVSSDSTGNDFF